MDILRRLQCQGWEEGEWLAMLLAFLQRAAIAAPSIASNAFKKSLLRDEEEEREKMSAVPSPPPSPSLSLSPVSLG